MKRWAFFLIMWMGFWSNAQSEAIFERATTAYNEGNYEEAISFYMEILDNGEHSAALYFNLANSYYKINQIAPSIYFYEKALLLKPEDAEIKNNLSYAQNMTLDAIEQIPETGISRLYNKVTKFLSFDQWAIAAVIFVMLFVLLYIAFYYFRYSSRKRIAFVSSMICLFLAFISVVLAFVQYNDFMGDRPAIVFSEEAVVKSEPNERSPEVFTLHEGTKIHILDSLNEWKKIRLGDGKTGWLVDQNIRALKDF